MRLDFGVIWEHGMPHIDGILNILRQYEDLELVWFKEYTPKDFALFIDQIYGLDTVPLEHLRAKNAYLNSVGTKTYLMLIKNKKPEPTMVGSGEYQHEQCMLINRFKWQVRETYNPKVNGQRTEDHMIHCSDYPEQTDRFLKIMELVPASDWLISKNPEFEWAPQHLGKFYNYRIKEYAIDDLLAGIVHNENVNKVIPLKETPHYLYVSGDKQKYVDYWNKWKGIKLTEDHSPDKFDKLISWFTNDKYKESNRLIIVDTGVILDGVHRASILAFMGIDKILTIDTKYAA